MTTDKQREATADEAAWRSHREKFDTRISHYEFHAIWQAALASPEVQKLVELCEELLSVETSNTLGNLWEKTHLIEASSGDPVYSAELTRAQLIEYRNRLKALQPFTQKKEG